MYFASSSSSEPHYVAVLEDYALTASTLKSLLSARQAGRLQGVLVLNSTNYNNAQSDNDDDDDAMFSPDAQAPQGYNSPDAQLGYGNNAYSWNTKGEGLFVYDLFGIPMAYVIDSDVADSLRAEAQADTKDASIVAEFNYYMGMDSVDSKQCLAWKDAATGQWAPKCLPLGGTSVWATAGSPPDATQGDARTVVMVAGSIDSTSFFHDVTPGANTAASNILALIMAAKLIGANLNDNKLDNLASRIVFGLFEGESYGFVGSRTFIRDVYSPKFTCNSSPVRSVYRLGDKSEYACLNPVRPSLAFTRLGNIAGMVTVDQVGHEVASGLLYVHADGNNDNFGNFLSNVMLSSGTSTVSVAKSSVNNNNGNGYPYPPTPLTSLLSISQGAVGGAVLTGYDYAFTNKVPYHSHMDSATVASIKLDSVASAATILARAAVAAAYDGGNYDSDSASAYAVNLIPELSASDESLVELAKCLYQNGACKLLKKYAAMEMANERAHTGLGMGDGAEFGSKPNYYTGVYNGYYGQPFVQVGESILGAYDGKDYGKKQSDAVGMVPRQLSNAIRGLLNDYLGRGKIGSYSSNSNGGGGTSSAVKCTKLSDCDNVDYCPNSGESATCTGGGVCVCTRATFHVALDEALQPALDMPTGYFEVSSNDAEITPMWTEPYWSSDVGVKVYRDVGWMPGFFTLVAGVAVAGVSLFAAFVLKVKLKKEKLY